MLKPINIFKMFQKPDALETAQTQLREYKLCLLREEAASSYHSKMVEYYVAGIKRLTNHTNQQD